MVHMHGAGNWKCPKCGSRHIDADEVEGKLVHYCLECGYKEGSGKWWSTKPEFKKIPKKQ